MTVGIPDDMRRTVLVSLAAHVVALGMLSVVAMVKVPPMGASAIQVMLVSKAAALSRVEPAPVVEASPPRVPATAAPPKAALPIAKDRPVEPLTKRVPEASLPKDLAQAQPHQMPAKKDAALPPPVKRERALPKNDVSRDLNEALRKAEETLQRSAAPPSGKPASPTVSVQPKLRTAEEINRLLGQLPAPGAPPRESRPPAPLKPDSVRPSAPPATPAPTVASASQATTAVPRAAALERCPPKARAYCPLLEAAINRVWNSDTDPAIRSVLESAGDSTATVRIVIQADGGIRDIRLNKSSGNEAYDRAVQSVLKELRHLPPLPEEMQGEPFVAVTSFTYVKKQDS